MWILARCLAEVTGRSRFFENEPFLKNSLSSNLFILFRKIFGRRVGLQPQMTSWCDSSGKRHVKFHTLESYLVHHESILRIKVGSFLSRRKFKLVFIPFPSLVFAGTQRVPLVFPFLLAIAHDTDTSQVSITNTTSPITQTHTCVSGSIGIAGYVCDNTATDPTTLTYDSAALTKAVSLGSGSNQSIWYITNPTTGSAKTWSFTPASSSWQTGGFTSWTGANTSALIGATGSNSGSSTAVSTTITTTVNNSYVQDTYYLNDASKTSSPDSPAILAWTQTTNIALENTKGESSYKSTTTAGSTTLSWTLSGTSIWRAVMVEIKPATGGAAVINPNFCTLLGVGQ